MCAWFEFFSFALGQNTWGVDDGRSCRRKRSKSSPRELNQASRTDTWQEWGKCLHCSSSGSKVGFDCVLQCPVEKQSTHPVSLCLHSRHWEGSFSSRPVLIYSNPLISFWQWSWNPSLPSVSPSQSVMLPSPSSSRFRLWLSFSYPFHGVRSSGNGYAGSGNRIPKTLCDSYPDVLSGLLDHIDGVLVIIFKIQLIQPCCCPLTESFELILNRSLKRQSGASLFQWAECSGRLGCGFAYCRLQWERDGCTEICLYG